MSQLQYMHTVTQSARRRAALACEKHPVENPPKWARWQFHSRVSHLLSGRYKDIRGLCDSEVLPETSPGRFRLNAVGLQYRPSKKRKTESMLIYSRSAHKWLLIVFKRLWNFKRWLWPTIGQTQTCIFWFSLNDLAERGKKTKSNL